eukprot:NODE_9751_length_1401_cov_17.595761.p1 GENE.NODE_9751_length_1401_cov_17.595761~~NODE_9751_length_1401_cov_17.595761.p1  ORF type:complete len:352 (+),score=20.98 NODE_9751_length_1401_cov_17.595761:98-1057(+)
MAGPGDMGTKVASAAASYQHLAHGGNPSRPMPCLADDDCTERAVKFNLLIEEDVGSWGQSSCGQAPVDCSAPPPFFDADTTPPMATPAVHSWMPHLEAMPAPMYARPQLGGNGRTGEDPDASRSRRRGAVARNEANTVGPPSTQLKQDAGCCGGGAGGGSGYPSRSRVYRHGFVPKNTNLLERYESADQHGAPVAFTTLMIRNIPNRYTQRDLVTELDSLGFAGAFDFVYLPVDTGTMANVGYAFVNFVNADRAQCCSEALNNYRFCRYQKTPGKVARVSVAHIQGLEANLAHYEKAAVNTARVRKRRPVLMANLQSHF